MSEAAQSPREGGAVGEVAATTRLQRALRLAEANCRDIPLPSHVVEDVGGWSDRYVSQYLAALGTGLGEAVRAWLGEPKLNVYFWPGYERSGRVLMNPANLGDRDFRRVPNSGIGSDCEEDPWIEDAQAAWFNVVLKPYCAELRLRDVRPGSTHEWLESSSVDKAPDLLAIEVRARGEPAARVEYLGDYGVRVTLGSDEFGHWAQSIREGIASVRAQSGRTELPGEAWPCPSTTPLEDQVRLAQYEAWFAACFRPELCNSNEIIVPIVKAVDGLPRKVLHPRVRESYLERLRQEQQELARLPSRKLKRYKAWYSFRMFEPVGQLTAISDEEVAPPSVLGTAMLLTSEYLEPACLQQLAAWIRVMYMQLRQSDAQAEGARQIREAERKTFLQRAWPETAIEFFAGTAPVPHDVPTELNEAAPGEIDEILAGKSAPQSELSRYVKTLRPYLSGLLGREPPPHWYRSRRLHQALKGLVGQHAKAHQGACERSGRPHLIREATYDLNLGSFVLLLAAATAGHNDWIDEFQWPEGEDKFQHIVDDQSPRQAMELALAFADSGTPDKEGFFRKLAVVKDTNRSGVRQVVLETDRLIVHLNWSMERAQKDNQTLMGYFHYEPPGWLGGEFVKGLHRASDALSRASNGRLPLCGLRIEPSPFIEGETTLELRAVAPDFWG